MSRLARLAAREARQDAQEKQVDAGLVDVAPIASPPSSAVPANLAALFQQDAPILVRVARRRQAELGIPMPEVVKRTLRAWSREVVGAKWPN